MYTFLLFLPYCFGQQKHSGFPQQPLKKGNQKKEGMFYHLEETVHFFLQAELADYLSHLP